MRSIIHIDMDAFFAAVEQRDNPEYRSRPIAVGGSSRRGVVAAASYEARTYGVRSAMPSSTAKRLCPQLIFVPPRFDVYREVSRQIRTILHEYTDVVEPLSLDEAYLDVTSPRTAFSSPITLAAAIKKAILYTTGLTASAGVSYNKFLAKMASDLEKPDGLTHIGPEDATSFLASLPVEEFHGVGRATAEKMKELGIYTGADLRARSEEELVRRFGKIGRFFFRVVRGEDHREVKPNRIRKSVGAERTFSRDIRDPIELEQRLRMIADVVSERLAAAGVSGRTLTLKIKYRDFSVTTRSTTLQRDLNDPDELAKLGLRLLSSSLTDRPVRLLGLSLSSLHPITGAGGARQLMLSFDQAEVGGASLKKGEAMSTKERFSGSSS